jgi:uncharacterized protein YceK
MMKKLLFLVFIMSLVVLAGCAKIQSPASSDVGIVDSAANAISDTDSISNGIEDQKTESELDGMSVALSDW